MVGTAWNTAESSFDTRRFDSRIAGEGDNDGLGGASDRDRVLFDFGVNASSSRASCLVRFDFPGVAPIGAAITVVDIELLSHSDSRVFFTPCTTHYKKEDVVRIVLRRAQRSPHAWVSNGPYRTHARHAATVGFHAIILQRRVSRYVSRQYTDTFLPDRDAPAQPSPAQKRLSSCSMSICVLFTRPVSVQQSLRNRDRRVYKEI